MSQNKQQRIEEIPAISALYEYFKKEEARPNTFTLLQFRTFEPLFRTEPGISPERIEQLTKLYKRNVDPYKKTVIIKSSTDKTVILELPPLFTPIKSLSPTLENEILVSINSKFAATGGGAPVHSSNAFGRMIKALENEQKNNKAVQDAYRDTFESTMKIFNDAYHPQPKQSASIQEKPTTSILNDTAWEFE